MDVLKQSTDEELVALYREGNERAFDELYGRYVPKLKRLMYHYISDPDEINDIFHEVFIRVVKHMNTFNISMTFSSWIYQIAVNCCKNHIGKSTKDNQLLEKEKYRISQSESTMPSPEEVLLTKNDIQAFNEAVGQLKDKFKDVFLLRYDHKLKYGEISEILNCSERTVKWRMKMAVEQISYNLKEMGII